MRQQVALSMLSQPSASDRIQGVGYSAEVKNPNDTTLAALFKAVDSDPNPNVRLAAVDALYLFRDRPGVRESLVKSLSVQSYPLVQVALIDFLVEVRETRAIDALKKLIEAGELTPEVKTAGRAGPEADHCLREAMKRTTRTIPVIAVTLALTAAAAVALGLAQNGVGPR